MDNVFEQELEKLCSTGEGRMKGALALRELTKLADGYADEASRPAAEAVLQTWVEGTAGTLRKGLAVAWLARARSAIAGSGMVRGAAAAVGRVEGKVGNVGAAAGEKLARSPLGAKSMADARLAGGNEAQARMAQRLRPGPSGVKPRVEVNTHAPAGRMEAAQPGQGPHLGEPMQAPKRNFGAEQQAASGHQPTGLSPEARTQAVHQDALRSAFKSGAESAGNAHAGQAARLGRVAARHGFRAGLAIGGAGAAGAGIHAALSEKEHKQRVEAGKHSHHGHAGAGFPQKA